MNTAEIDGIRRALRDQLGAEVELLEETPGRLYVSTPFRFDDGDHLEIYLVSENGAFRFTDEGLTLMRVSYELDVETPTRERVLEQALLTHRIRNEAGALVMEAPAAELGPALLGYVQALLHVADLTYLRREIVRSAFLEEFRLFLSENVRDRKVEFDFSDPVVDPHKMYAIDCSIRNGQAPLFVFAVNSDTRCRDATIAILHYERHDYKFESMAVFEEFEVVSTRVSAKLMDVCGKQFSNLPSNKERILAHVHEHT